MVRVHLEAQHRLAPREAVFLSSAIILTPKIYILPVVKMPRIVSILSVLLLLLAACSGGTGHTALSRAESIMEQHPDSALAILDSVNPSALTSDASRAKYALLLTQAKMKNNAFPASDSLINTAVAFYEGEGNADEMKSLFYQGNVRFYNSEYSAAIIPAIRAHELAIKLNDDYWRAKTAEQIADIYASTYYDDYEYRQEAIDYYEKAGRIDNHRYAICDLAIRYGNKRNPGKAISILDSISQIAKSEQPIDSGLFVYSSYPLIPLYLLVMHPDSAYIVYDELQEFGDLHIKTIKDYEYLAEIELYRGNHDTAFEILSQLLAIAQSNTEKVSVYDGMVKYFKRTGDNLKALDFTDSILYIQNEETYEVLKQSVLAKQRDELDYIAEVERNKADRRLYIIIVVVLATFVVIFLIFAYYRVKTKNKDIEIKNKILTIYSLTQTIEEQNNNLKQYSESKAEIASTVSSLFKERWNTLNLICSQFLTNENTSADYKRIVSELDKEIKSLRSHQSLDKIEKAVNLYMDDILTRLRQQCPFLKSDELTLLTLLFAGLSAKAICLITDTNFKYFYVKKKRIYNKIIDASPIDLELFKSHFN